MRTVRLVKVLGLLLLVAACGKSEVAELPKPQEISDGAVGHFCGMGLTEHPGPKGQIFVGAAKEPVWFASVREVFAFTLLPEEPKNITAIYVTDMGKARNWQMPEPGTWIDARQAYYVIASGRHAGMGGDEAVPFGEEPQAQRFVAEHGGRIVRFAEMPDDFVLQGTGVSGQDAESDGASGADAAKDLGRATP